MVETKVLAIHATLRILAGKRDKIFSCYLHYLKVLLIVRIILIYTVIKPYEHKVLFPFFRNIGNLCEYDFSSFNQKNSLFVTVYLFFEFFGAHILQCVYIPMVLGFYKINYKLLYSLVLCRWDAYTCSYLFNFNVFYSLYLYFQLFIFFFC